MDAFELQTGICHTTTSVVQSLMLYLQEQIRDNLF